MHEFADLYMIYLIFSFPTEFFKINRRPVKLLRRHKSCLFIILLVNCTSFRRIPVVSEMTNWPKWLFVCVGQRIWPNAVLRLRREWRSVTTFNHADQPETALICVVPFLFWLSDFLKKKTSNQFSSVQLGNWFSILYTSDSRRSLFTISSLSWSVKRNDILKLPTMSSMDMGNKLWVSKRNYAGRGRHYTRLCDSDPPLCSCIIWLVQSHGQMRDTHCLYVCSIAAPSRHSSAHRAQWRYVHLI